MKNILILFLVIAFSVFADWGTEDSGNLSSISSNVSAMTSNIGYIRNQWEHWLRPSWIDMGDLIQDNGNWLKSIYLGVDVEEITGETYTQDLGKYKDYYHGVYDVPFQVPDETDDYNNYIKQYSSVNYVSAITSDNQTANSFLNHGYDFDFLNLGMSKIAAKGLDDETWVRQESENLGILDTMESTISENIDSVLAPGEATNPNVLFHLDLSSVANLMVNKGYWVTNPLNWQFDIKLIPSEGDYLYPIYTWWNDETLFYPYFYKLCLKAVIVLGCFAYCYNHVVQTWNA